MQSRPIRASLSRLINLDTIPGWGLIAAGLQLWLNPSLAQTVAGLSYLATRPSSEFWEGTYIIIGFLLVLAGAIRPKHGREILGGIGVACWLALTGALLVRSPHMLATALSIVLTGAMIRSALFPEQGA